MSEPLAQLFLSVIIRGFLRRLSPAPATQPQSARSLLRCNGCVLTSTLLAEQLQHLLGVTFTKCDLTLTVEVDFVEDDEARRRRDAGCRHFL